MFSLFKKKRVVQSQENKKQITYFDDNIAKEILCSIKQEYGLDYEKQEDIILRKLERFALKYELYSFEALSEYIKSSNTNKQALINMLTVGETYFYRETAHFEILSELCKKEDIKRILCAPCSSGEEAYSIAMYLEAKGVGSNVEILGIDVNSQSIKATRAAIYSSRSVSLVPKELLHKNFTQDGEYFLLKDSLKNSVHFHVQNIFDDSLYTLGSFDVIFCRNMLIYFNHRKKKEVLERLKKLLVPNGVLFLGHADISFKPKIFTKIHLAQGFYFQKKSHT